MDARSGTGTVRQREQALCSVVYVSTVDVSQFNGPSIHLTNVTRNLATLGHDVTLMLAKPQKPVPFDMKARGLQICWGLDLARLRAPRAANIVPMLPRIASRGDNAVLYVRASPLTAIAGWVGRLRGLPTQVVEYNGWLADEAREMGFSASLCALVERLQVHEARKAVRVRVVTDKLKDILVAKGCDRNRIAVIGNGTDTGLFKPLDKQAIRRELIDTGGAAGPIFGFLGNLWPVIDFDTLFGALSAVRQKHPTASLWVVGDGVSRQRLEDLKGRFPGDAVRLFGALPPQQANRIMAAADVLVAPFVSARNQRIGLSPLKIRDYAAAGRPIAATQLPGIGELGEQPWIRLYEPENSEALAQGLCDLLAQDLEELGARARDYALANYSWETITAQVSALIQAACREGRSVPLDHGNSADVA